MGETLKRLSGKTVIIVNAKIGAPSDIEHVFSDNNSSHLVSVRGLYADFLNTVHIRIIDNRRDAL